MKLMPNACGRSVDQMMICCLDDCVRRGGGCFCAYAAITLVCSIRGKRMMRLILAKCL